MKKGFIVCLAFLYLFTSTHFWVLAEELPPLPIPEASPEGPIDSPPVIEPPVEPLPEPVPEPAPEPLPEPVPEPAPEPLPEPVPEPAPEPILTPVPAPIPEPVLPPAPVCVQSPVYLNEILADPGEDDALNEFIEIYNAGAEAVDLSGWKLDDARADDGVYSFENSQINYVVEPGQLLTLFRPETKITLNNDVDFVTLYDMNGQTVDSFEFESAGADKSWGRNPGNLQEWMVLQPPSPNTPNLYEQNQPPVPIIEEPGDTDVVSDPTPVEDYPSYSLLSEVMPDPDGADEGAEWIELYNDNSFGIDLSGWYLDDADGGSSPYRILDDTVILPQNYLVFQGPDLKLSLKNSEDSVRLLNPNKEVSQQIAYAGALEGQSYARRDSWDFVWTSIVTPGAVNDFPAPPRAYSSGDVLIQSALPNPDGPDTGNEQIVLGSRLTEDISLLGWSLADAGGTSRPLPDLILQAGMSLVLGSADFELSLNNSDETLNLFDPTGNLIDTLFWKSSESGQALVNPNSLQNGLTMKVARIIDGDTIEVNYSENSFTVRLIGVDTPETVHPEKPIEYYGKQAAAYLNELLSGKQVRLEFDETRADKYGRLLAYAYLDDWMVNEEILKLGYGYAYTRFPFLYKDEFLAFESEARNAKRGLWADPQAQVIVERIIAEDAADPDGEEEVVEPEPIAQAEEPEIEFVEEEDQNTYEECSSEFLQIDSFMPNPQKGFGTEFIRLINTGAEAVCLNGWSLDDKTDGGSKAFLIRGGGVAPGAYRTFRRQETKLALNDSDDCVSLIDPIGHLADQICYQKTHKNETFTHAGGDWKPQPRAVKSSAKSRAVSSRYSFKRDLVSYQSELPASQYTGLINYVDEDAKALTLETGQCGRVVVSYANSSVNLATAKQMIDFAKPVTVKVYESESVKNLLAIEPAPLPEASKESQNLRMWDDWFFLLVLLNLLIWCPFWFRRRS